MAMVETILVIFLGLALLVFLILAIAAISIIIGILRNVKRISQRAEETTESVADIIKLVGKRVAPVALSAAVAAAFRRFKASDKDKS